MSTTSNHQEIKTSSFAGLETATVDDRRIAARFASKLGVTLTAMGSAKAHPCRAEDLSEGGLFVHLPAELGLSVGQRCEVRFPANPDSPKFSNCAGETRYATIVRTQMLEDAPKKMLGAGLRFDQPLFM